MFVDELLGGKVGNIWRRNQCKQENEWQLHDVIWNNCEIPFWELYILYLCFWLVACLCQFTDLFLHNTKDGSKANHKWKKKKSVGKTFV